MLKINYLPLAILLFLISLGCEKAKDQTHTTWHEIAGREASQRPLYRFKAPDNWKIILPEDKENLSDTTRPICECSVEEGGQSIRVTIHNFPSDKIDDRIPPMAQISRWKRQFQYLDPTSILITPQAYGGFAGYLFQASGFLNGKSISMLAWTMQLAPAHYRKLTPPNLHETLSFVRERRADFTIKATGPQDLVQKHQRAIYAFARSFELIDPIYTETH